MFVPDRDPVVSARGAGATVPVHALSGPGLPQYPALDPGLHISSFHDAGVRVDGQQWIAGGGHQFVMAPARGGGGFGNGGPWIQPPPSVDSVANLDFGLACYTGHVGQSPCMPLSD